MRSFPVFKINFYGNIVDIEYCVSLCCTEKWISYTYTYITVFRFFFFHIGHYRALRRLSVLYSMLAILRLQENFKIRSNFSGNLSMANILYSTESLLNAL